MHIIGHAKLQKNIEYQKCKLKNNRKTALFHTFLEKNARALAYVKNFL